MSEQDYWNRFITTGNVRDYLLYKNVSQRGEVMLIEADDRGSGDLGNQNG